jgi:hypothetical protein
MLAAAAAVAIVTGLRAAASAGIAAVVVAVRAWRSDPARGSRLVAPAPALVLALGRAGDPERQQQRDRRREESRESPLPVHGSLRYQVHPCR